MEDSAPALSPAAHRFAAVFLSPTSLPDAVAGLQSRLAKMDTLEVSSHLRGKSAVEAVQKAGRGYVIFHIVDKPGLVEALTVLIDLRPLVRQGLLRVVGFNQSDIPKASDILMQKGCSEILASGITDRTLAYKVERAVSIVERSYQKLQQSAHQDENQKVVSRGAARNPQTESGADASKKIVWVAPLELKSDFWLMKRKTDARPARGQWIVDMVGPPPSHGKWESQEKLWKWIPRSSDAALVGDPGNWYFRGREPEFSWKDLRWTFIGPEAALFFRPEGISGQPGSDEKSSRFLADSKGLRIARNSPAALAALPAIRKALEMEVRIRSANSVRGGEMNLQIEALPLGAELSLDLGPEGDFENDGPDDLLLENERTTGGNIRFARPKENDRGPSIFKTEPVAESPINRHPDLESEPEVPWSELQPDGDSPLSAPDDVGSVRMEVRLRSARGEPVDVRLLDLFDSYLMVEGELADLSVGAAVVVEGRASHAKGAANFSVVGKVVEIEPDQVATVELDARALVAMNGFKDLFALRQNSITKFMKAAKGF